MYTHDLSRHCTSLLNAFTICLSLSIFSVGIGCEEARRVRLESSSSNTQDTGFEAGTMAGEIAGMEAGISAGEMAGEESGTMAGNMAGNEAGLEAGEAMAGMEMAGIEPEYAPSRLEAQSEVLIDGLSILDAWYLGAVNGVETWVLLAEQGLLLWRNVTPQSASVQALPEGVTVQRGELTPIRFDQSQNSVPNTRPLQAFLLAGIPALLFPNDLWLAAQSNESNDSTQPWQRSPLSEQFNAASSALWFEDGQAGTLWLSHDIGLSQWIEETETWRTPNVLNSLAQSVIQAGPWANSSQALWAWTQQENLVYAIAEQAKWHDESWLSTIAPVFVADSVWGLKEGKLYGGLLGEAWAHLVHPVLSTLMIDHIWSGSQALWFLAEQKLWRYTPQNEEQNLGYTSIEGTWRGGLSDQGSGLYLWGNQGFNHLSVEQLPSWDLSGDQLALDTLHAELRNINAEEVTGAWAWLSQEALSDPNVIDPQSLPTEKIDLQSNDFELTLDREWLSTSQITGNSAWLIAYVERAEREPLLVQKSFTIIQPPTWTDVEVLYQRSCQSCHDGRGGARDLSTATLWQAGIEEIIFVTEMQSMPIGLPPLSANEVDILRRWRDYGFIQY